jgi:hypothetical protein
MIFCYSCGSLDPRAHGERHELPDAHAFLANNNKPRDDAEGELRSDEPPPFNPFVEQWVDESENAVQ